MERLNAKTKLIGLLGYPLSHSFSPIMQNAAFKERGMNYLYIPIEVRSEDLPDVVKGIKRMNFAGFNITTPHKISIMKYLDRLDDSAFLIGAVNTAVVSDGSIVGYNTDGRGFVRSLEEHTGQSVTGKNVLVLGSGGAARAITMTLAVREAGYIYICNRTGERAKELSNRINRRIRQCSEAVPMEHNRIKDALKKTDIVINTTNVGMYPHTRCTPLDISLTTGDAVVCDIVYNPPETMLLKEAAQRGLRTVNGLAMLVYQGAEAFKLWTGVHAPVKTMFGALSEGLKNPR